MSDSMDIIQDCCRKIMLALKDGSFTRDDLNFLIRFFEELVKVSRKKLAERQDVSP